MAELLEELLARCRNGDDDAAEILVRRFRRWAMDLASHILGDQHLAEDAVQEAFVAALQRLDDLRAAEAFPGWLRQIVRTHATRIARGRRERPGGAAGSPPDSGPGPAQRAIDDEVRCLVRHAVAALPDPARDAAALFYLNELDHYRVARSLEIPAGTVKRRLYDARQALRDGLIDSLGEPAPRTPGGERRIPF